MMKKFVIAAIAALALAAVSQQQAKAWFNLSVGASANANVSWGGWKCGCFQTEPWPQQGYGTPFFNNYGPASSGVPSYPVNPYGGSSYGGGFGGYVAPAPTP